MRRRLFSRRVRQTAPRCLRGRGLFCPGETAAGGEDRARASLPCGASNTCVMRLVGRGCFHAGRGKTCFCGNLFALRRLFLCGQRKNRTPCGGPTFFGGKSARMSAERAASEVGRIREDGWEVSGKPHQRAAVCNCDSTEGCAGDSPEKRGPVFAGVSRSPFFPRAGNADASDE